MLEHFLLDNIYYRCIIAFLLTVVLAFAQDINALKKKWVFAILVSLPLFMIFTNVYNDFGFVILMILLSALAYNRYLRNRDTRNSLNI